VIARFRSDRARVLGLLLGVLVPIIMLPLGGSDAAEVPFFLSFFLIWVALAIGLFLYLFSGMGTIGARIGRVGTVIGAFGIGTAIGWVFTWFVLAWFIH
jgi:hypothetical protein